MTFGRSIYTFNLIVNLIVQLNVSRSIPNSKLYNDTKDVVYLSQNKNRL